MTKLPGEHPLRRSLNDEVHARPPEALMAPCRLSFLALEDAGGDRSVHQAPVVALCRQFGVAPPDPRASHFSADFGTFRLKWEKHTEFTRYKVIVPSKGEAPFEVRAVDAVPEAWVSSLPGRLIAGVHLEHLQAAREPLDLERLSKRYFAGNVLIGSTIADGRAQAFTDFRIREDGFSRFMIYDASLAPRQAGRSVQRLLEIDAYRILAMMALPVARELGPHLSNAEAELVSITATLASDDAQDEPKLLDRLTRLEAQIHQRLFASAPRFSASDAYYRLIRQRTDELREGRLEGVQTFREFIERRLSPAMSTCAATATRQEKLSQRVAETTQLFSTRVEVSRQRQSQDVLESLNSRALLQLRLQQTVEGLSVAAITYYVVGLIAYLAKGIVYAGLPVSPEVLIAASVPIVAVLVALAVRRIRRHIAPGHGDGGS